MIFEIAGYVRETLAHNILFTIGFLLLLGFFIGKAAVMVKLPEISGYIIAGIMVNSFTTGFISTEMNKSLHVVTEVAIGLLALSIGSDFAFKKVRRLGLDILVITVVQFIFTFSAVVLCLYFLKMQIPYAIILGVTACATAPAIIVAEVHHLRAYGKFVDYLFGTVVLIDAFCVIIFGAAFTMVTNYLNISAGDSSILLNSLKEILFSIFLGIFSGIVIHLITVKRSNDHEILIITLSMVFITTGVSLVFHLSPLILNIVTGTVLANVSIKNQRLFKLIEPFTPPVYALFFIIAGIEINPGVFLKPGIMVMALAYFLSRFAGKYAGIWLGCRIINTDPAVRNNLGLCMLSQAGIALGFVLLIQTSPMMSRIAEDSIERILFTNMMNIVLISIFLCELIGPVMTRYGILNGNKMEE